MVKRHISLRDTLRKCFAAEYISTWQNIFGGYFHREYILALTLLPVIVFKTLDQLVECHGNGAEDDDGSDHHAQLEHLRTVDDQIAEAASCGEKFTDDNAHKRQSDVDFHIAQDQWNGTGKNHFKECIPAIAAQSIDKLQHFGVRLTETGIQADDGAKDGDGDTRHDDCVYSGAEPDDQQWGQRRFRQGIEDN